MRAFALEQNAGVNSLIAAILPSTGEGHRPQPGGGAQATLAEAEAEAQKGMAEMSQVYNEGGRERRRPALPPAHDPALR